MIGRFIFAILVTITAAFAQGDSPTASRIVVPKAWSDTALAEWATPLPVLGVRPGSYSEAEFYKIPASTFYRAYPVYHPDHEPKGYWEWVQKQPPKPLIEPERLRTENDWLEAGRIVFQELAVLIGPAGAAEPIALARSRIALEQARVEMLPDGTLPLRWVVTPGGVRLGQRACQGCHARYLPDGTRIDGAPGNGMGEVGNLLRSVSTNPRERSDTELSQVRSQGYALWGVPWLKEDVHAVIKSMSWEDLDELFPFDLQYRVAIRARNNGSPFYPSKTLDLIGIRDRKYLDHTATHTHRDIADIMRYALLVQCCDPGIFGPHQMRRLPQVRLSDELVFALAHYIYSLKPPPNPHARNPRAAEGKKVFEREQCGMCHTPPLYTNNKLTPAKGFTPPDDHPYKHDIMPISVGTDPGLALKTRKGTGFYRVPSLKGVWYRGLYGHHGDIASLEDWFDPARLRDDYVPSGWKGYRTSQRAVPGHEFGLKISAKDKQALIAFLRTL